MSSGCRDPIDRKGVPLARLYLTAWRRRYAVCHEWRANHPVPSRNPKLEVTAALAEAERAIKAFAQAYAAVRRAMATTAPK